MKVTFADKTNASQPTGATTEMPAEHYNEIKDVVNTNDDIATPLSVAYSTNVRADRIRFKSKFTMVGAVALTLDTTLAIPGLGETIPFVGDGNNITISGGTIVPSQHATIATEVGVELLLVLIWSGSYWQVGIEGANSTPSSVLFSYDATGTTIDTSKLTVANPDTPDVVLSQNNDLIITPANLVTHDWLLNYFEGKTIVNTSFVISFDLQKLFQDNNTNFAVGMWRDNLNTDRINISRVLVAEEVNIVARINSFNELLDQIPLDLSTQKRCKIITTDTSATFYWDNAGTWTQLGTVTFSSQAIPWKFFFAGDSNTPQVNQGDPTNVNRIRVTKLDDDAIHLI